jgi:hemerythrin-like domain-containing protein
MTLSLEFIRDEHRNIARVLKALEDLARDDARLKKSIGSDLLASILYYLRVYPYAVHHPKEERHLFPAAAAIDAAAAAAVAALRQEHTEGYAELRQIETAAADCGDAAGFARLKDAILSFVAHEYRHMNREETEIIPAAERALTPEAIVAMRRQFAAAGDPAFGENVHAGFEALFRHITEKA